MSSTDRKYGMGCGAVFCVICAVGCLLLATNGAGKMAVIVGGVGALVFMSLARGTSVAHATNAMEESSYDAEQRVALLTAGTPIEPFCLYLRPFRSDDFYISNPQGTKLPLLPIYHRPTKVQWETLFSKIVEQRTRLLVIGQRGGSIGGDRIESSDKEWRERFVLLATFAGAIFIYPSGRGGSLWELEWLAKNLWLEKCVFVIPPHFEEVGRSHDEDWPSTREVLRSLGVNAPEVVGEHGIIFSIHASANLDLSTAAGRSSLRGFLQPLIRPRGQNFASLWNEYKTAEAALRGEWPQTRPPISAEERPRGRNAAETQGLIGRLSVWLSNLSAGRTVALMLIGLLLLAVLLLFASE